MGNVFNTCGATRDKPRQASVEIRRFEQQTEQPVVAEDEKTILKAMIGPIGGSGKLTAEQDAGRRRFGM